MNIEPDTDFDTPWKVILEKYFQHLLEFLFPRIAREIDWSKSLIHLDKELLKIQKTQWWVTNWRTN